MDNPKYAMMERERRFLVRALHCGLLDGARPTLVEDRYLDGTRLRLRRTTEVATGAITMKLGKKYRSPDPVSRPVVSTYLDPAEYDVLATLPAAILVKRRHRIAHAGFPVAVDVFEGPLTGLILVEAEGEVSGFAAPEWTAREVTSDPFFDGGNLARLDAAALAEALSQ